MVSGITAHLGQGSTTSSAPGTTTSTTTTTTTTTITTTSIPVDAGTTSISGIITSTSTGSTTSTTPGEGGCVDMDRDGYGDKCGPGADCDDADPFYTTVCPDCRMTVIAMPASLLPRSSGAGRKFLIIGKRGTVLDDQTPIRWEAGEIVVASRRIFFKRFMFITTVFSAAAQSTGSSRMLIGTCSAQVKFF